MSNKYLEKIAEDTKDKKVGYGKAFLGALGGGLVGMGLSTSVPGFKTGFGLDRMAESSKDQIGTGHTEHEFLKRHFKDIKVEIIKEHNSPIGPHVLRTTEDIPSFFLQKGLNIDTLKLKDLKHLKNLKAKKILYGSKNHGIHMHEMGHALDFKNISSMPHLLKYNATRVGVGAVGLGTTLHGIKKGNKTEAAGGVILGSSPILFSELKANKNAYKAFKEFEGKEVANKFLKRIASRNMSHYALPIAATAVATAGITKFLHRNDTPR